MVMQINLKFQDDFFELARNYANVKGYMSIQELVREALRDKIFDDLEIKAQYKKILESKEANTFLSEKESEQFYKEMKKKAGM